MPIDCSIRCEGGLGAPAGEVGVSAGGAKEGAESLLQLTQTHFAVPIKEEEKSHSKIKVGAAPSLELVWSLS